MASRFYRVKLVAPNTSGELNPAFTSFVLNDLDNGFTVAEQAARILVYLQRSMSVMCEGSVFVQEIAVATTPLGDYVPVPFPTAEHAAVKAATTFFEDIGPMGFGYSSAITLSSQTSSGRGDSLCVREICAAGGRSGKGRHFLPFLAREAIGATGLVGPSQAAAVNIAYRECFMGDGGGILATAALPEVFSRKDAVAYFVAQIQVTQIPSRLRSRTR